MCVANVVPCIYVHCNGVVITFVLNSYTLLYL